MSNKSDRLHPGTDEIRDRFEAWWENEGKFIPHNTETDRKQAASLAWQNGALIAIGVVTSIRRK
jgi:hypothetical protein